MLSLLTGARTEELRALRWHNVDLAGNFDADPVMRLFVFISRTGTPLDAHNVRRSFRKVVVAAGLVAKEWTPRELRHSFVSLL